MRKNIFRRFFNRLLHTFARSLPGATTLRPVLHRWRGVKIGRQVFIAHTRGAGKIIIGKNAYLGPNTVLITSSGRTLKIGEGAVIGAGMVITSDVAPQMFIPPQPARAVARATVPLATADNMEDFIRGLVPVKRPGQARPPESGASGS